MEHNQCYIDGRLCTGARFSFCDECRSAKQQNAEQIRKAKTPAEVTLAHTLSEERTSNEN